MSTDLKQDILNAVRKSNCPHYKSNSHACWHCAYSYHITEVQNGTHITVDYGCGNAEYDAKKYKVKPRKIKNKKMKFVIDKITGGYVSIKTIEKGEQILFEMFKDKEKKI